jgi:adenine-specific DNA-methyltransferase
MEKLSKQDGGSRDLLADNIARLREIFPEVFADGLVDFDALKQTLGEYVLDLDERYSFTWHGKSRARQIAQVPSTGTLLPCPEESVDWDSTKNMFIEGDNLEVLKLLQKSYHRKVKMIYIDPPYNTGKEFIYPDKWQDNLDTYLRYTGQVDDEGLKLSANAETSGRYHTNWLNMMYPRLKLARNLLTDDGAISISIDDNEVVNLRKLCDEIFGEENFVACIANTNNPKGRSDDKFIATAHEYLLLYCKAKGAFRAFGFEPDEGIIKRYKKEDANGGVYREIDLRKTGDGDRREDRPNLFYYFLYNSETGELFPTRDCAVPAGYRQIKPIKSDGGDGRWRWGFDTAVANVDNLQARFMPNRRVWGVFERDFLANRGLVTATSSWSFKDVNSERGSEEFETLGFERRVFPRPKPVGTIQRAIQVCMERGAGGIVLDFFAGSCSSAQAVMQQNTTDGGNRRFVMVQLPEVCSPDSDAERAGFSTIARIGLERIRRVIERIEKSGSSDCRQLGVKVFRLSASNIKSWDAGFDSIENDLIDSVDNIKAGRTEEDVLYELLLKYGLDLAMSIESRDIEGCTVTVIGAGALVVCLADDISLEVVSGIAALKGELKPEFMRVVFRDSGFADDVSKTNAVQFLRQVGIHDVKSL